MFTKQHFVAFAQLIRKMQNRKDQETLVIELLKMFKQDNPRFDSARFLKAAGFESNQRTAPHESVNEAPVVGSGQRARIQFDGWINGIKKELGLAKFVSSVLKKAGINNDSVSSLEKLSNDFSRKLEPLVHNISGELKNTTESKINESFDAPMKLVPLLPVGSLKEESSPNFGHWIGELIDADGKTIRKWVRRDIEFSEFRIEVLNAFRNEKRAAELRITRWK